MKTSPSEAALELAVTQPVLPLEPRGKRPLAGLGLRHATRDTETVREWWRRWPDANLGLRCDGLVVIDVDGDDGERSLSSLQRQFGQLPASRSQQTGRGRHLLYATEVELGNSTGPLGNPEGIDLRGGSRGYIVAPPSVHASGHQYRWMDERPPAPLPLGWIEQLSRRPRTARVEVGATHVLGLDGETAYGRAALEGELERVLQATDGKRNWQLNMAAFKLGQLVAGDQLPLASVERELFRAARAVGLEDPRDRHNVAAVIRCGLDAGLSYPRYPKPRRQT
jgi:Bifunctional DNA primase/polymerase, N-terminal